MVVISAGMVSAADTADDQNDDVTNVIGGGEQDTGEEAGLAEVGEGADESDDVAEEETNETNDFEGNMSEGTVLNAADYNETNELGSAPDVVDSTPIRDTHATGNPLLVLLVAVVGIGVSSLRHRK